jgi:hypothetical protein
MIMVIKAMSKIKYRVSIINKAVPGIFCVPGPEENHRENLIPRNSIVSFVDKLIFGETNFLVVKWENKKFLLTEHQFKSNLIKINQR